MAFDPTDTVANPIGETGDLRIVERNAEDFDSLINGTGTVENRNGDVLRTYQLLESQVGTLISRAFDTLQDLISDNTVVVGDVVTCAGFNTLGDNGANTYEILASGTGPEFFALSGSGLVARALFLDGVVRAEQLGLSGSDPTTDSAAYQNAANYAGENQLKCTVSTDFTQSSNLSIQGDLELVINSDITLTSGVTNAIETLDVQRGSDQNLTANASAGDTVIQVSTAGLTGIEAGDYILVSSTEVFDVGRTDSLFGEGMLVQSFDGTSITLDRPLTFAYTTANTAKVAVFKSYRINVGGQGSFTGDGTTNQWAFDVAHCKGSKIGQGLSATGCRLGSFRYTDSVDSVMVRPEGGDSAAPTLGYTTSVYGASRNIYILNLVSNVGVRHAFTTNNPNPASGAGIPIDVFIVDGVSKGTHLGGDGFDTHAASWNVNFIRCKSHDATASGFNWECASGSIIDCEEYNSTNEGYRVRNETQQVGDFEFYDNKGEGCLEHGMQLGSKNNASAVPFRQVRIDRNDYSDAGMFGMLLSTGLAQDVILGANVTTGTSGDFQNDAENVRSSSMLNTSLRRANLAASSTITIPPEATAVTLTTAGTINTINGLVDGVPVYVRKSSNGNAVIFDEAGGNFQLNTGSTYTMPNSNSMVVIVRYDTVILVNPVV